MTDRANGSQEQEWQGQQCARHVVGEAGRQRSLDKLPLWHVLQPHNRAAPCIEAAQAGGVLSLGS